MKRTGRLFILLLLASAAAQVAAALAQDNLTPLQAAIKKQQERLASAEGEERRDAVTRLGVLRHPDASRAALVGLQDPLAIVRATATQAILSLPSEEAAAALVPLLKDKDAFVRQEVAYALGQTRSKSAVGPLVERLIRDKESGVRGAAAVALGKIGDEGAVGPLVGLLRPDMAITSASSKSKARRENNVFVSRSAARSLGQIRSRLGVAVLIVIVNDQKATDDLRREAAIGLGLIGDAAAIPSLRAALAAGDPYLSAASFEALRLIEIAERDRRH
jgi:HEAT repeat protein